MMQTMMVVRAKRNCLVWIFMEPSSSIRCLHARLDLVDDRKLATMALESLPMPAGRKYAVMPGSWMGFDQGNHQLKQLLIISICLAFLWGLLFPQPALAVLVHEGEIDGALFRVLQPDQWNGKLLVIAHGYRPPEANLVVDLDPEAPFVRQLVYGGWMIAKTSYRRNGLVIAEGLEDLDNLVAHVTDKFGKPQMVILEGSSMGGSIAVKAAERAVAQPENNLYDGVVALGAAMDIRVGDLQLAWTYLPGLPVLFVSNQNEQSGPAGYIRAVSQHGIRPALWSLKRDGHVNLNFAERMAALIAVEGWIATKKRVPGDAPHGWDATIALGSAQSTAQGVNGGLAGRVVRVDPAHGNIQTSFVLSDLEKLGLQRGDDVAVLVGDSVISAQWGASFDDVSQGEFVVFVTATGYVRLAINMGDAAQALNLGEGDALTIKSVAH
jgi:pimeloyl-ACP methyl ester carboxylesterase